MSDPRLECGGVVDVEVRWRIDGDPAADDVFVAPAVGHTGVEAAEDVEMVVKDGEAADGDGEVLSEDFEPGFDPGLAVRHAFATEEGPPDAAGNAVVVASDRDVHQLPPGHRHRGASLRIRGVLYARIIRPPWPVVKDYACPFGLLRARFKCDPYYSAAMTIITTVVRWQAFAV